jgi:hypothetical protein
MKTHYQDTEHVDFMDGVIEPGDVDKDGHRHPTDPLHIPWDSSLEQLLFNTVYEWGRNGVQVDHTAPFYQALVKEMTKLGMTA